MLRLLFDVRGRIGRMPFVLGLAGAGIVFWLGIRASEAALPWMARILAPRGINAGFALNLIWLALGVALVWCVIALAAQRLHDGGHSGWWAVAAVLPLAALALLDDAIFLVSRSLVLPTAVQLAVLAAAGAIGLWVLWQCAQPGRDA